MADSTYTVLEVDVADDLTAIAQRLDRVETSRVAILLPWDQVALQEAIDVEILRRAGLRRGMHIAVVSADPLVRSLAKACGLIAFRSLDAARSAPPWRMVQPRPPSPRPRRWWQEPIPARPLPAPVRPAWAHWVGVGFRAVAFVLTLFVLFFGMYSIVPQAQVTLVPAGEEFALIVPVYAARDLDSVDDNGRLVPARPVGLEVSGFLEVPTTGKVDMALGRTSGEVLFTNLLFQEYVVPRGTVVRTSSTSYPIRFQTTEEVQVPAGGQAAAPIESLADGVGNIAAYQINQVEGIVGSAVRVINPEPTSGSDTSQVRVVTQADRDRAREQLMGQVLEDAHYRLSSSDILEPGEIVPRQSLVIQAVPKEAYTRFIGEQADTVGLELRLLVSGLAVDVGQARHVAQVSLEERLPAGYSLVEVWFEVGDVAEEPLGPGDLTIFITAHGYASAVIDTDLALANVAGVPLEEASANLQASLPLAQPPTIDVWPSALRRMPALPLRIDVEVQPFRGAGELAGLAQR